MFGSISETILNEIHCKDQVNFVHQMSDKNPVDWVWVSLAEATEMLHGSYLIHIEYKYEMLI